MVEVVTYHDKEEGNFTITLDVIDTEIAVNDPLVQPFGFNELRFYKTFLEAGKTYHFLGIFSISYSMEYFL